MGSKGTKLGGSFWIVGASWVALAALAPVTSEAAGPIPGNGQVEPFITGNVKYYGGHVMTHAQVVAVNWGSNVDSTVATGARAFYAKMVDSPYLDWMGEYDTIGLKGVVDGQTGSQQHVFRGTTLATVTITPKNTNATLTDTEIQTELKAQLAAGKLPPPKIDAEGGVDTIYMIAFPPEVTNIDQQAAGSSMCANTTGSWCAYHGTVTVPNVSDGVPYGIMPDYSSVCAACGPTTWSTLEIYTSLASHELAEAITDTEIGLTTGYTRPLAFYDQTNGEVGDICEHSASNWLMYEGYMVQKIWSQRLKQCITNNPSLTLCTGKNRPCTPCTAQDCTGATGACDLDEASAKWGQCVGCAKDTDCKTATKPICDTSTNACRGCDKDSECSGATPKCETSAGACVACLVDADCKSASAPKCDASTHACVAPPPPPGSADGGGGGIQNPDGGASGGVGAGDTPPPSSGGPSSGGCAMASRSATPEVAAVLPMLAGVLAFRRRRQRARRAR